MAKKRILVQINERKKNEKKKLLTSLVEWKKEINFLAPVQQMNEKIYGKMQNFYFTLTRWLNPQHKFK